MTSALGTPHAPRRWHGGLWATAAALLLVPAVAMRVDGSGVDWSAMDFAVAGTLLASACGAYEVVARRSGRVLERAGFAVAVLAALGLVWVNLAVGLVGDGANAANLLFMGVVPVAFAGATLARFQARGMARAMAATAAVHALIGIVAASTPLGRAHDDAMHILGVTAFFALPWLASAALFGLAARADAGVDGGT